MYHFEYFNKWNLKQLIKYVYLSLSPDKPCQYVNASINSVKCKEAMLNFSLIALTSSSVALSIFLIALIFS